MNGKQQKINIYALAKASGFSPSTVSKAINHTGRISEKTRAIILEKAKEMNYIASYHATALSKNKSWIIAVIYSDNLGIGLSHPHFSVVLEYFKQEVEQAGYEITFINRNMGQRKMSYLEFCRYRNVDGVFVVNFYNLSKQIPELIDSGIPMVSADAGNPDITTITSDDLAGGRLATEYLINLGHTSIYHLAGPEYTASGRLRSQGYEETMKKHGIHDYNIYQADNFGFEDGYNKAMEIIKKNDYPTAIFIASDWLALGAIKAFQEHNIRIPEDISVIGYDNLEFLKYNNPALTTVSQNKAEIGRRSATSLLEKIAGKEVSSTTINVTIVERDTCQEHPKQ